MRVAAVLVFVAACSSEPGTVVYVQCDAGQPFAQDAATDVAPAEAGRDAPAEADAWSSPLGVSCTAGGPACPAAEWPGLGQESQFCGDRNYPDAPTITFGRCMFYCSKLGSTPEDIDPRRQSLCIQLGGICQGGNGHIPICFPKQ